MYYLPTSCLFLFFLFSSFHPLPYASSKQELGWCEAQFQCGDITAGFPFSSGSRPQICGHPSLVLHCFNNKTSIIISDHFYNVLHIDQTSNTLRLARAELEGSFCNATYTATTLPSDIFELSSTYKSLTVFYLCDPKLSYRSSYTCPGRGLVSVSQNLDYKYSCQDSFTINVPKNFIPEEKELNLTQLEKALQEGFEVKVKIDEKACQKCSSSGGTCGFENSTQICCKQASSTGCNKLHPLLDADELHRLCSPSFTCGNQRGLLYPFWIPGRKECGHPDFELNCSRGFPELSISSVKFRILAANYDSGIIRLARSDKIGDPCLQDSLTTSFNETILPLAPTTDLLTIYYDCSRDFSSFVSTFVKDLDCPDGRDDRGNYYVTRNLPFLLLQGNSGLLNDFGRSCSRNVSIPASRTTLSMVESTPSTDNLKKALEDGFELQVNSDCRTCIDSKGACGFSQTSSKFECYYIEEPQTPQVDSSARNRDAGHLSTGEKAGIAVASVSGLAILILACLSCLIRRRRKTLNNPRSKTSGDLKRKTWNDPRRRTSGDSRQQYLKALIPLKHYSYVQVKRITKSFAEVIGKGGFGTVYRGTLCDGRSVAVKILKESQGNGEDFINEVASMSKTSHVNIVTLLGFCSEGSKRAIIYEFMENGSLDKFISSKRSSNMNWRELYRIALGVARGLEYLHHGCRTRIVHFDIKPQNVLLDDNLCPKVSDFGLARLCEKKESILSLLDTRGTIGYIAPELFSRMYGRVSHKSDVYSYGMLVLEMIGARNKTSTEDSASNPSSMYFPEWIYKDLEKGDNGRLIENDINSEEEEIAKKMTLVGLWCIQSSPSDRPPMDRVVEMMEGSLNALEVPPRPVFHIPAAPVQESSTISEDILAYTRVCSINVA